MKTPNVHRLSSSNPTEAKRYHDDILKQVAEYLDGACGIEFSLSDTLTLDDFTHQNLTLRIDRIFLADGSAS